MHSFKTARVSNPTPCTFAYFLRVSCFFAKYMNVFLLRAELEKLSPVTSIQINTTATNMRSVKPLYAPNEVDRNTKSRTIDRVNRLHSVHLRGALGKSILLHTQFLLLFFIFLSKLSVSFTSFTKRKVPATALALLQ